MQPGTPPTIRSLAAELKISPITVSRALRGHATVRKALAARIQRHAKKRGYRSDPVVAEVMGGLGRAKGSRYRETVAFVWTHELGTATAEESGAREAAEALGYRLETIKPWVESLAERDVSRILWARGIRGVLLAPNNSRPDPRYDLDWPRFAAVLVGSSLVNTGLTRVSRDYYHDAKLALTRLRAAGHARIGLVLDASIHERTDRRYAAAFAAHTTNDAPPVHLVDPAGTPAAERARFERWLARARPDAVITDFHSTRDWVPAPLPHARLLLNPRDPGPGVRTDLVRVGAEAMRALDGLLRSNKLGLLPEPVSILVRGSWTD
ncbi:MAG: LacI family transcriptional regulator [Rariglobus sp.]|jgi:DNA-binding LacI/PurR family transcriptional regulator|nr:LacI family transcriptional regulator [Rariglobus sp.]